MILKIKKEKENKKIIKQQNERKRQKIYEKSVCGTLPEIDWEGIRECASSYSRALSSWVHVCPLCVE